MIQDISKLLREEIPESLISTLKETVISATQPGTIVQDFNRLLEFVREKPPEVSKSQHLLPMKLLEAINQLLSQPVQLALKRPIQKSYPHINGLYWLLRASTVVSVDIRGKKPYLQVDDAQYASWHALNPTEQYFTLLEIWLLHAVPEIIGESRGFLGTCMNLNDLTEGVRLLSEPKKFEKTSDHKVLLEYLKYQPGLHFLALMELFGFAEIIHTTPTTTGNWGIRAITLTPLAFAIIALAYRAKLDNLQAEDEEESPHFGQWQPLFQPYFPAWQNNLTFPAAAYQEGIFIFKVSLGDAWRRIAIPASHTWHDVAYTILDAFEFDDDGHLFNFEYKDRFGSRVFIEREEAPFADEVKVGDIGLQAGSAVLFRFDFGDDWHFDMILEAINPPDKRQKISKILEKYGEPPRQYPDWDEDDDDDENYE